MEHGTSAAYAAHRKAGEKPCPECRAWANAASKASREKRKAKDAAAKQSAGLPTEEPKPKRAKSLRDYADALVKSDLAVYTHQVKLADGTTFSIHKDVESAERSRALVKGDATIEPFTPTPTTYWTGGLKYDH